MLKYTDIKSEPVYSKNSKKLIGWRLFWTVETGYYDIDGRRFFKETWFRNSYKSMCRFQNRLLKHNENHK
ncbi:MAG: hypothetical protein J5742_01170 [Alphaproteobacteria bacterium]|nr:hypothetical protein [Alphaproteobacteria bacterium]